MPTYNDALALFHDWTETESLRRHGYAVEAAMGWYAEHFGENVALWRMTGMLHDMDYEKHPTSEEHPYVGVKFLREAGYPDEMLNAIMGHAHYTNTPRESLLAKTLFAVDELAGFIVAVALVRPTMMEGMKAKSVRKKMKAKGFAAAVSRDDIAAGASDLNIELNDHITNVIAGLTLESDRLFNANN